MIWAENNADGKGGKFSFSLPIKAKREAVATKSLALSQLVNYPQ